MAIDLQTVLSKFNALGIDINSDFYQLPLSTACELHEIARQQGYRKPKNANGSTARYFFTAVKRLQARQ